MKRTVALLLSTAVAVGCSKTTDDMLNQIDPPPSAGTPAQDDTVASAAKPDFERIDQIVYQRFQPLMLSVAGAGIPNNSQGLLGRNREWGGMYSPRFQVGAGQALRVTLVAGRPAEGKKAFQAIKAGTSVIRSDGYVPTSLPRQVSGGAVVKHQDVVSAAAFFLADACPAVLALREADNASSYASASDLAAVTQALSRAVNWLVGERHVLTAADAEAPNRLLLNALAYRSCGTLAGNQQALVEASRFAGMAQAVFHNDGYFLERGGWDTSYQSVAIRAGNELMLSGYPDASGEMSRILRVGSDWLAGRIDSRGRLDSSGNTRTCTGGETFLGDEKQVSVREVFLALAYQGARDNREALWQEADRFSAWVSSSEGAKAILNCTQ